MDLGFAQQRVIGHIGLEAAALAAAAERAIEMHLGMAEFRSTATGAAIEAVVDHDPHADAVFDGDDNEIAHAPPLAEKLLGLGHQIGVIVDEDGKGKLSFQLAAQIHVAF